MFEESERIFRDAWTAIWVLFVVSRVQAAGKYKQEGKNYVVQDGDIIFFKFNVTTSGKK